MRTFKGSKLSTELLKELIKTKPNPNSTCWGVDLWCKVLEKNKFVILPCSWFNTEWGLSLPLEAFKKDVTYIVDLYDGAFVWHWHNRWDANIEEGSKFQILEKIHYEKFNQKFNESLKYEFYK